MVAELPGLSVAIVCYSSDFPLLEQVLHRLGEAVHYARRHACLGQTALWLIDNGPADVQVMKLRSLLGGDIVATAFNRTEVRTGHGNVGYGLGHNLALAGGCLDYHLILNPDVLMAEDSLAEALAFMIAHPEAALLAPAVIDGEGQIQYLCKRYPTVWDLFLRGFAPRFFRVLFQRRLGHYEMRDVIGGRVVWDVPIVSGCFMLFRGAMLEQLHGFSSAYFLYFEDFDISLRASQFGSIVYVPSVRIIHFGGRAARKGWRHIGLFLRSALTFFREHGWKWL